MPIYGYIYYITNDTLTIIFQGVDEPFSLKIKDQRRIKLKQECRAYASNIVLNPTRELKSRYYNNCIPKLGIRSISTKLPK